jgi:metallo-beta-lactamase class B
MPLSVTRYIKESNALPEFTFTKDTVFAIGGKKIQTFYPGKGHTTDNIVIWIADEKVLYGGCFIKSTENQSLGNIADADVKVWPKSIKRAMKQFPDPKFIIPGHFGWDGNGLKHTLELLQQKFQEIK